MQKFLFQWLTGFDVSESLPASLAHAHEAAMLWAGFYDGDPRGLNQQALEAFADDVETSIVHPSTILGEVIQKSNDLLGCRGDRGASMPCFRWKRNDEGPIVNFWIGASRAFVHGLASKNQASVVAVLNKGLNPNEDWSIHDSVFWKYELPTLGSEVSEGQLRYDFDFRPQLLLVDMRGTCKELVALVARKFAMIDLGTGVEWRHEVLDLLYEKPIMCFDCAKDQCDLDQALAARVRYCLGKDGWLSSARHWFRETKCPRFEYRFGAAVATPIS